MAKEEKKQAEEAQNIEENVQEQKADKKEAKKELKKVEEQVGVFTLLVVTVGATLQKFLTLAKRRKKRH